MSEGFIDKLRAEGVEISEPRQWPIEWIVLRAQPEAYWPAIEGKKPITAGPIVLCSKCFTVLDGWHRLARAWRAKQRYVEVVFANTHFYQQGENDYCRPDLGAWINETIRPWVDLKAVSTCYHRDDLNVPGFHKLYRALKEFGGNPPNTPLRLWERAKCVTYMGCTVEKAILDVGTRESLVPHYLAHRPGGTKRVVALDLNTEQIKPDESLEIKRGDARELPFADNTFDGVISSSCINLIPGDGDTKALLEMIRVVKPEKLVAVSCSFGQYFEDFPSRATDRRIYSKQALYDRLIAPASQKATLCLPADFERADWTDWPGAQLTENVQACVLVFRKDRR